MSRFLVSGRISALGINDGSGWAVGWREAWLLTLRLRFLFAVTLPSCLFPHIPLLEARGVGALLAFWLLAVMNEQRIFQNTLN
jgi:hypothetical protein